MPSIVPGFEYDIFISYRQNDNKYDQWVSEFVHKLKVELEATIKDRLTIYFDENPHDGIRESHQVGKSLEGKLRSLILIPIVSMTYCDTSSFAWQNEFVPFKSLASADVFGLDIRLQNGNFASRILPVKIHEIDDVDVRLLERELGGVLRSIDFIYQATGVNRPMRPKDDDHAEGASHYLYRNQINKVANAIREIIGGIKKASQKEEVAAPTPTEVLNRITSSISASLPENIRYRVIAGNAPTVFLAWTSGDLKSKREEMAIVLQKAGFNVIPNHDCPSDEQEFMQKTSVGLSQASCSLHILSGEFGRRFEVDDEKSFPQFQLEEAMKKSVSSEDEFHTFVWYSPQPGLETKPIQQRFINSIRNNISKNMVFSNSAGAMQLVDDMRAIMFREMKKELDTKDTDIFFIFNSQDEQDAMRITDIISSEYPIETMNILPDGEDEYRELSSQQIPRSKLAVVYFRYAADWALPFIKQIWKQVGGASSTTPIMLVGEDDPKTNAARIFKAPKVVSTIVSKQEVPVEVKKVYHKIVEL